MTREELSQRMTNLAGATLPILRRLRPDAADDSAGLLKDIDELSDAYHLALQGGMALAYSMAATETATVAGGYPHGVGENGR